MAIRTAVVPMMRPGLFQHLSTRFGSQPDVLAAEILAYLLTTSGAVRDAIVEICSIAAPGVASATTGLHFRIAAPSTHGQVPTLLGLDAEGVTRFVVDARFWSALADEQPVALHRQLTPGRGGALLVVAPTQRFTPLWAELRRRCRLAGLPIHGDHTAGDPIRWTRVGARQVMILASWSALLASARTRLVAAGDTQAVYEVDRLADLCAQMDADTFPPLTADELTGVSARRLMQLFRLVDDLASACEARGLGTAAADHGGETGQGYYGRQLRLGATTLTVCLSVQRWATLRETPYWLLVYDANRRPARGSEARLESLSLEIPPRLLRDADTGCPLVPLFPVVGVERSAVVDDLVRQVSDVARLLGEGPTAGFGSRA